MDDIELKKAVETLLFITDQPLSTSRIAQITGERDAGKVSNIVGQIMQEYEERGAAQIVEIAGGFQMASRPAFGPLIRKLFAEKMTMRLSGAALETLSIVAYKQPITRAEIEEVRGVEVIAALETLLDKRLIRVVGRRESVGRPLLYGTTPDFLRHFGLKGVDELPPVESFKPPEPPEGEAPAGAGEPQPVPAAAEAPEPAEGGAEPAPGGPQAA